MSLRDLALQAIETAINQLIDLDGQAAKQLIANHGRSIAIALRGTGWVFYFIPNQQGHVQLFANLEGEPDCCISGNPLDLMRASDKDQSTAQLFAGHVQITGDTELAHRFSQVLGSLSIDWEEQLSKFIGDTAAHAVGRQTRATQARAESVSQTLQQNLGEYLSEEARLVPHPYEMAAWSEDVSTIRNDVERLVARVQLLEQQP
jgi:ubiquinone biosynthesis protein UbiJ